MTHKGIRFLVAAALVTGATTAADAQQQGGAGVPLPGAGDSTRISQGNRDNNADYNHLIGGANQPIAKKDTQARHAAVPATTADITVGASLRDMKGVVIGTIASINSGQAVVDTGQTKIGVPLIAFGKDDKGLMLGMTAEKFNQLIAQAHAKSQASN